MAEGSRNTKIGLAILCLGLIIWGLTDVRQRAHFDHALAAQDSSVILNHRTDFTVFTEAGAAFFDGRNPYEVTNPRGWPYLYPPLFAILMAPLHILPPQWQGVVWYFLSLVMAWGCYRETVRLWRHSRISELTDGHGGKKTFRWIQIASLTTLLIPTLDCLQRGQVGILILYLLLLGLRLVLEDGSWQKMVLGGVVLSLSISFKVIPALPVFFLLFVLMVHRIQAPESMVRPFRFLGAGTGVLTGLFLFFFIVPSMFIGWQTNAAHLKTWSRVIGDQAVGTRAETPFLNRVPKNQSLKNALYLSGNQIAFELSDRSEPNPWLYNETEGRFMSSPAATQGILVIRVLLVLLLIPLAWRRAGGGPLDQLAAIGLACAAMLIVSPIARGHYFMLELPAVLFVSLWVWKQMGSQKAILCAGIPAALSVMHYVFITFPQIFGFLGVGTLFMGTLGIGTALWYAVMACVLIMIPAPKAKTDT